MAARDNGDSNEGKKVASYTGRHGKCSTKIPCPTIIETNPGEKE
jgi:hypothetical protein